MNFTIWALVLMGALLGGSWLIDKWIAKSRGYKKEW